MDSAELFNPMSKAAIAESVVNRLLASQLHPLAPIQSFSGAGVYALYYVGSMPQYSAISDGNASTPIYVGKATPAGGRIGGFDLSASVGSVLFGRLRQHAGSIASAGFPPEHFSCRFLIVDDIWIPLAEQLMITLYRPVWNHVVHGFGNHDPGKNRRLGAKPLWDEVHPGRSWANNQGPADLSVDEIWARVEAHLSGFYVPEDAPPDE